VQFLWDNLTSHILFHNWRVDRVLAEKDRLLFAVIFVQELRVVAFRAVYLSAEFRKMWAFEAVACFFAAYIN